MTEREDDVAAQQDALARHAAESFAAAHPDETEQVPSVSAHRRALAARLAAGPRSDPSSSPQPRVVANRSFGRAAVVGALAAVAAAIVLLMWPRSPATPARDQTPAGYALEFGGAATRLGDEARVRVRAGDTLVVRARPSRPSPTPRTRARWSGPDSAEVRDVVVEDEPGGAVILRATIDRAPGRHTLEVLIGNESCEWDRPALGCEQPSVEVEVEG